MRLNRHALTHLRERSGYSKSGLARALGISIGTLADLESGRRNASPELVRRLSEVLSVPIPALLKYPPVTEDGDGRAIDDTADVDVAAGEP